MVKKWACAHTHTRRGTRLSLFPLYLSVSLLRFLSLVRPWPSVLKPSGVLPLISPSVCDSTFCQRAQASVQNMWFPAPRRYGRVPESLVLDHMSWHCMEMETGMTFKLSSSLTDVGTTATKNMYISVFFRKTHTWWQTLDLQWPQGQSFFFFFHLWACWGTQSVSHLLRGSFFLTAPSNCWGHSMKEGSVKIKVSDGSRNLDAYGAFGRSTKRCTPLFSTC